MPPGTRLGKYEIIRGVAVGGMAELYLARAAAIGAFDRLVALKRILPQFAADEEFVRMFLDEARLTAKLQHPSIAQVYDIGMEPEGLFFTMEFIRGEDVQTVLRAADRNDEPVPLAVAIAIAIGAAGGLHAAHEQRGPDGELLGIVHRDISPSNVIVSFDGGVKLIDFGVAKARGRQTKTKNGTIKGKISYMSPEQCRGEPLDRRSDVFSLGILLFELTTTQRLYVGDNEFAVLKRIVYEDPPRPSERVPGYPPDLEAVVMRALSRNVGRRYQSVRELEQDLVAVARALSLDISPAALGAYMCGAFPESLAAWERLGQEEDAAAGARARGAAGVVGDRGDTIADSPDDMLRPDASPDRSGSVSLDGDDRLLPDALPEELGSVIVDGDDTLLPDALPDAIGSASLDGDDTLRPDDADSVSVDGDDTLRPDDADSVSVDGDETLRPDESVLIHLASALPPLSSLPPLPVARPLASDGPGQLIQTVMHRPASAGPVEDAVATRMRLGTAATDPQAPSLQVPGLRVRVRRRHVLAAAMILFMACLLGVAVSRSGGAPAAASVSPPADFDLIAGARALVAGVMARAAEPDVDAPARTTPARQGKSAAPPAGSAAPPARPPADSDGASPASADTSALAATSEEEGEALPAQDRDGAQRSAGASRAAAPRSRKRSRPEPARRAGSAQLLDVRAAPATAPKREKKKRWDPDAPLPP